MRTPITRFERAAGAFLLVALLLALAGVVGAAGRIHFFDLFREGFVLYAVTDNGYGVALGSPVRVRGVEVGSVTDLSLVDDPQHPGKPVRLTIRIQDRAAVFLGDRTVAVIIEPPMGSGMPPFGTAGVELRPAGDHPLARRSVIVADGQESIVQSMARMNRDVSAMSNQLGGSIAEIRETFASIRQLTEALATGKGVAGRLLDDERLAGDLEGTMLEAKGAAAEARELLAAVQGLTQRTGGVVDDAREISQSGKRVMTKVDAALDVVPRLLASTERTLAASEELVKSLRSTATAAPELVHKVDVSLDETMRLVDAAQHSLLFRSNLPDRPVVRSESEVRPPVTPPAPPRDAQPK